MFRALAPLLFVCACRFDTATVRDLEFTSADGAVPTHDATSAVVDASPVADSAAPLLACDGVGTLGNPIVHLSQINSLPTGRYEFFLGLQSFQGEVDVDEDGAAWLMVLNYLHLSSNNAELVVRNDGLPLRNGELLGADESGTEYWGHVSPSLLSAFGAEELRFYGATSNHGRRIHFRTVDRDLIEYFETGSGSSDSVGQGFTPYSDHTSELPANQNDEFEDEGELAMTHFPFYRNGGNHWGIRGRGFRWEVDDFNNQAGNQHDTLHRVWVRSPGTCGDGFLQGTEQCDDGNLIPGDGCDCCVSGG